MGDALVVAVGSRAAALQPLQPFEPVAQVALDGAAFAEQDAYAVLAQVDGDPPAQRLDAAVGGVADAPTTSGSSR
ncbi:hypothetical protein ABZW49_46080, partial [Nonomuraea wenchangensis]